MADPRLNSLLQLKGRGGLQMSKLLEHRGFQGSIEASSEDNCLFGKLQFISALVSYEGQIAAELSQAFRDAVDDYLATGALCVPTSS